MGRVKSGALGRAIERNIGLALASLVTLLFEGSGGFGSHTSGPPSTKSVALDFSKGSLKMGDARGVVFLLLFESEDVAVLDPGGFLEAFKR